MSYSVAATAAIPEHLEQTGFANAHASNETRNMINSLRSIVSGHALFGKPGTALSFRGKVSPAHDRNWA